MLPMLLPQGREPIAQRQAVVSLHRLVLVTAVLAPLVSGRIAVAEDATTPSTSPVAVEAKGAERATAPSDGKLLFNFRYQPWQEVLDWFAQQADLSLVIESPPPGTFNYHDSRRYTTSEALDVLNSVLLTKGYTLVRSGRMLVLVNLEDGIPPNLVSDVPLDELDKHGDYELIRVLFPVSNMSPEDAAKEVQSLLGPQGTVVTLPQAKQIQVTETGGRLRTIRRVINAVERPTDDTRAIRELPLKHLSFDDAMPFLRQMLGIPDDAFSTPDGSLHVAKDVTGWKLLVSGTPSRVSRLAEVLKLIDVPEAASGIAGAPQLEVYSITSADPQAVLDVLKTLLEGDKSVKLAVDTVSGHLVAFARPAQQATIRATIEQMQRDSRQVAVIPLSTIDPQVAVVSINKLFGGLDKDKPDASAPRVDADLTTRSLLVRGTGGQVAQIRDLLSQLGETDDEVGSSRSKERVRMLPLTGAAARSALSQIEQVWSTMRPNRIRVVTPTKSIPTYTPSDRSDPDPETAPPTVPDRTQSRPTDRGADRAVRNELPGELEGGRIVTVALESNGEGPMQLAQLLRYVDDQVEKAGPSRTGAPIVVAPGPGGVLIASDDLEALDDFEELLTTVAGRSSTTTRDYAVFYLKYSKAANVADVLSAIFGGSASRGGGIMNDIAGAAMGDMGGGIMGDLLLGGGGAASTGGFTSASVDIVPDVRLNALVVRAKQADLDTVEQLLQVLDQRVGPEDVEADARPRLIPVYNTSASEIATVVQQLYQDRMSGGTTGQISPQDMLKMIRGGGKGQDLEQQLQKMTVGVDERSNSLVVRAPDPLFEEVKALVTQLDQGELDSPEVTRVVSLKNTNSAAVQKALSSMLGSAAKNSTSNANERPPDGRRGGDNDDSPDEQARRNFRRMMEMSREMRDFQRMQEGGGRSGRGGDRGPGGGPGGGGGGPGGGERGGGRGARGGN